MSELTLRFQIDANGTLPEPYYTRKNTYDEIAIECEFRDKFGNNKSQLAYFGDKDKLLKIKLIIDETPKLK